MHTTHSIFLALAICLPGCGADSDSEPYTLDRGEDSPAAAPMDTTLPADGSTRPVEDGGKIVKPTPANGGCNEDPPDLCGQCLKTTCCGRLLVCAAGNPSACLGAATCVDDCKSFCGPGAVIADDSSAKKPVPAEFTSCAAVIDSYTTVGTPLVVKNAPGDCDLYLGDTLRITSSLTIEPGAVIRVAPKSKIFVARGAQLHAVGRGDARIRFLGAEDVHGSWQGIHLFGATDSISRIEYTDIENGGSEQYRGAVFGESGKLAFKHNRVSKSSVDGLLLWGGAELTEFEANVFEDIRGFGLVVPSDSVGALDAASDYVGRSRPNGQPYIKLYDWGPTKPAVWRNTGAPLYAWNGFHIEVPLTLEPGVTLVSESERGVSISLAGSLTAVGTAARPIVFMGRTKMPGSWEGLLFNQSSTSISRLEHVRIEYGGQPFSSFSAATSLRTTGGSGTLTVANSTFADIAGIPACDTERAPITLGPNVTVSNAGASSPLLSVPRCN